MVPVHIGETSSATPTIHWVPVTNKHVSEIYYAAWVPAAICLHKQINCHFSICVCFHQATGRVFPYVKRGTSFSYLHILTHPSPPLSSPYPCVHVALWKKANTIIFDFLFACTVHFAHPSLPRPSWLRANEKAVLSVARSLYPLRIIRREQFWCL